MQHRMETRELFMLDGPDGLIHGTYHKPDNDSSERTSKRSEQNRVGMLFLNGLAATRAANGDVVAYWADALAERGYPSFRLDLPGCGDSEGDPPTEWLRFINRGGYASIASNAIQELVSRFNLSGVVILGHCAGAVSAVYTAAASHRCKGIVLIDPYFYVPQSERRRVRKQLSQWAEENRIAGVLSDVYGEFKKTVLSVCSNVFPDNANIPLLRCWKEIASTGMPIAILKRPERKTSSDNSKLREFDYLKYILKLAGRRSRVAVKLVEGTNHSFANRLGRTTVLQHTEQWLDDYFPLAACRDSAMNSVRPESSNRKIAVEIAGSF